VAAWNRRQENYRLGTRTILTHLQKGVLNPPNLKGEGKREKGGKKKWNNSACCAEFERNKKFEKEKEEDGFLSNCRVSTWEYKKTRRGQPWRGRGLRVSPGVGGEPDQECATLSLAERETGGQRARENKVDEKTEKSEENPPSEGLPRLKKKMGNAKRNVESRPYTRTDGARLRARTIGSTICGKHSLCCPYGGKRERPSR